ncbi:MAG: YfhO family protein, partial [Thermoanaerobaculia bacterium]
QLALCRRVDAKLLRTIPELTGRELDPRTIPDYMRAILPALENAGVKLGLEIDVTKHGHGFVVISEAAWNGWRAYLDGKRVSVHRANHAFLSVFVPEGHHTVVLRYMPRSFVVGRAITFLTLALIVIGSALSREIWLTPP